MIFYIMASDPPAPRRESQCFLGSDVISPDPSKGSHRVREGDTHTFSITWTAFILCWK